MTAQQRGSCRRIPAIRNPEPETRNLDLDQSFHQEEGQIVLDRDFTGELLDAGQNLVLQFNW